MKAANSAKSPMRISGACTPYCLVASSPSASISASAAALSWRPKLSMPTCRNSAAAPFAVTKHRAEIAEAGGLAGARRRQIVARYRDGQIGPQAQFAAVRIGGQKHAAADVLATEIEKRLGRLQHRRRDPRIRIVGAARIGRDQRFRPRVGLWLRLAEFGGLLDIVITRCGGPLAWRASLFDEDCARAVNACEFKSFGCINGGCSRGRREGSAAACSAARRRQHASRRRRADRPGKGSRRRTPAAAGAGSGRR